MRKINLKKLTFILVFMNVIFFIGINYFNYFKPQIESEASEKRPDYETQAKDVYLNIMTTDKMVYKMCSQIVNGEHNVMMMFDDAEDENNFKINNDTLNNVSKMDLFMYTGKGNETWIDKFIEKLKKGKVGIIDLSRGTKTINNSKTLLSDNKENKYNGYYWLSPDEYKISLYNVKNAIQERDIKNREIYEKNYESILLKISEKERELQKSADFFNGKKVILIGDNLEYLMQYLKIEYVKIPQDISDEEFKKKVDIICDNSEKNNKKLTNANNSKESDDKVIFILDKNQESDIIKKELNSLHKKVLNVNIDKNKDYVEYLEEVSNSINKLKEQNK